MYPVEVMKAPPLSKANERIDETHTSWSPSNAQGRDKNKLPVTPAFPTPSHPGQCRCLVHVLTVPRGVHRGESDDIQVLGCRQKTIPCATCRSRAYAVPECAHLLQHSFRFLLFCRFVALSKYQLLPLVFGYKRVSRSFNHQQQNVFHET